MLARKCSMGGRAAFAHPRASEVVPESRLEIRIHLPPAYGERGAAIAFRGSYSAAETGQLVAVTIYLGRTSGAEPASPID
jgi:hypothetical protein